MPFLETYFFSFFENWLAVLFASTLLYQNLVYIKGVIERRSLRSTCLFFFLSYLYLSCYCCRSYIRIIFWFIEVCLVVWFCSSVGTQGLDPELSDILCVQLFSCTYVGACMNYIQWPMPSRQLRAGFWGCVIYLQTLSLELASGAGVWMETMCNDIHVLQLLVSLLGAFCLSFVYK